MKRLIQILVVALLFIPMQASAAPTAGGSVTVPNGGPTFWVSNVVRNQSVSVRISDLPKDKKYNVYVGNIGNGFGYGYKVGQVTKTSGNSINVTYRIPSALRGQVLLGIQLKNTKDGSKAYNIFENTDGWNASKPLYLTQNSSSSSDSAGRSVQIFGGPTFWIHDVGPGNNVTIRVSNYPKTEKYQVTMGLVGDQLSPGIAVGLLDGSMGSTFNASFQIPSSLWDAYQIFVRLENTFTGHYGYTAFTNTDPWTLVDLPMSPSALFAASYVGGSTGTIPYMNIIGVVQNSEVTIQTYNFPAGKDFIVTMGKIGTRGIGGIQVGVQNSGAGGSFVVSYPIPAPLHGDEMISIRLDSTSSGHYAYDWFNNTDGNIGPSSSATYGGIASLPPGVYPSTTIVGVSKDNTVTVSGYNFTKQDTYTVRIGAYGSLGIGGVVVDTFSTDSTGTFTATFTIPASFAGADKLAIRFESNNTPYYAYDWFTNTDMP